MSRWLETAPDGSVVESIADIEQCRWLYNDVCCNTECKLCGDMPFDGEREPYACSCYEAEVIGVARG